jgi:hypothetical protein
VKPWPDSVTVPVALVRSDLSPLALKLWIVLGKWQRSCFPSNRTILSYLPRDTSESSLRRAKTELVEKSFLVVERRKDETLRDTSNRYVLMWPGEGLETERGEGLETEPLGGRETEPLITLKKQEQEKTVPLEPDGSNEIRDDFAAFWALYPDRNGKKLDRGKAEAVWRRLSAAKHRAALVGVENYAASGQMPKDAHRWLRDECWTDWQTPAEEKRSESSSPGLRLAQRMMTKARQGGSDDGRRVLRDMGTLGSGLPDEQGAR